jgi:hypothetical protein
MINSFQDNSDQDKIEGTRIPKKVNNGKIENVTFPLLFCLFMIDTLKCKLLFHTI